MRAVRIDNLRIKILIERNVHTDKSSLKIDAIDENMLILKDAAPKTTFENINDVRIFLKVAGNWKEYQLGNFMPVYANGLEGDKDIKSIKFNVTNTSEKDFLRDLTLARC